MRRLYSALVSLSREATVLITPGQQGKIQSTNQNRQEGDKGSVLSIIESTVEIIKVKNYAITRK
jgi:hypothetical protein